MRAVSSLAGMPGAHLPRVRPVVRPRARRLARPIAGVLAVLWLSAACSAAEPERGSSTATTPATAGSLGTTGTAATATGTSTTGPAASAVAPDAASTATSAPSPASAPATASTLPGGGTRIFPEHRLVGFSGYPGSPALGRLGIGNLDDRALEIDALGQQYADGRRPLPVFELIATVVHPKPGPDGLYRSRIDEAIVRTHLEAARRHGALLLLNIQPGRAAFLDEVKHWAPWLREPDVGLALDPEWAVGAGQVPGRVFGRTTGAELDAVAAYLAGIVAANRLPEKVLVYHQLHTSIVRDPAGLTPHPGVALVVSVDGIGTRAQKTATWRSVLAVTPDHVHKGFKLFYDEDADTGPLMTPAQVLALTPQPEYVLYE